MGKYTEFYKKHHAETAYGTSGRGRAKWIIPYLDRSHETLLDWGAGSRGLEKSLAGRGIGVTSYDACVPGIDTKPDRQFDVVVTTDVLEHIPPEELAAVLLELIGYTRKRGIHFIPSFPANLVLPDGNNAHLIQENAEWWKNKFEEHGVTVVVAEDKVSPANQSSALIVFDRS